MSNLDLVFQNLTRDKSIKKDFFKKILAISARELNFHKKVEVSVNLVGENKIKSLNKKYRHKDKVTDVLSFPLADETFIKYGIMTLGDIFICLPFAKKEAKRENIDMKEKLAQLAVHGFLHLAGYDHEESKLRAEKMFNLERRILNKLEF